MYYRSSGFTDYRQATRKITDSPTKQEKIVDEPTPNMVQYFTNVYRHDNNILHDL